MPTQKDYLVTPSGSQTLTNKGIDADSNLVQNLEVGNLKPTSVSTAIPATGAVDTKLATEKAVADGLATKQNILQVSTMPAASEANLGKIVQYIGETTSMYTNGYFYKSVFSAVYRWISIDVQDKGVSWGDIDGILMNQSDLYYALNEKQDTLTFDDTPTASSDNPVKSGGIKTALDAKQKIITISTDEPTGGEDGDIWLQVE